MGDGQELGSWTPLGVGEVVRLFSAAPFRYLAPDLQLLFKSKGLRDKDHLDARHVIPRLTPTRRHALQALLSDDHPWQQLLNRPD